MTFPGLGRSFRDIVPFHEGNIGSVAPCTQRHLLKIRAAIATKNAAEKFKAHDTLRPEIAAQDGVQKRHLVPSWGVERS